VQAASPPSARVPAGPQPSRRGFAVVDAVLTVLLLLAVGATVALALRAVRHWYGERAGQPYELPVDRRGTVQRAAASGVAAVLAATLAVPLIAGHGSADGPAAGTRVVAAATGTRGVDAEAPEPPAPSPPARTPEPAPPAPEVRTVGHPAGGTLQALRDGTRVWLPPKYDSANAARIAYPVVLVHATGSGSDLYAAFARQAHLGLADPFLLVTPPTCGPDPAAVLAEVSRRYRALTVRTARAVIGIGAQAPCAVREALAHPARYQAGAGISGTYPPLAPPAGPYPSLLLAADAGQTSARASAKRLRDALHPTGDEVRLVDGVAKRRDLLAVVDTYLTEKLDGPSRVAAPRRPVPSARTPAAGTATAASKAAPAGPAVRPAAGAGRAKPAPGAKSTP
jgi:hypothetical protein